jgi:hypothetical protein
MYRAHRRFIGHRWLFRYLHDLVKSALLGLYDSSSFPYLKSIGPCGSPYYTRRGLPGSFVYSRGIPLRVPWRSAGALFVA